MPHFPFQSTRNHILFQSIVAEDKRDSPCKGPLLWKRPRRCTLLTMNCVIMSHSALIWVSLENDINISWREPIISHSPKNNFPGLYFCGPQSQFLLHPHITSVFQSQSFQSLSRVWLSATPWTIARQASLSITNSWSPLKPMSVESVMPSNPSHPLSSPSPPVFNLS